ncbi:MAG: type II toxin-antitoxin system RelB/DinJ family antitoxin [Lachnoclostridium sp.]|nr:type II toxin-antitoxin system RelB/DinJ family antitoxin [Lachnospira sp.]MCM1248554.1 type II toxin-antitoxin system RelB/DinJ family antitoxin [Lachnoclostridium sp.]
MAQTVNVNFKLDPVVKQKMEDVCNEIGISMSAAFTIFAKKVGNERRIPFDLTADPFYSTENMIELERRISSVLEGTSTLKEHELIEADRE